MLWLAEAPSVCREKHLCNIVYRGLRRIFKVHGCPGEEDRSHLPSPGGTRGPPGPIHMARAQACAKTSGARLLRLFPRSSLGGSRPHQDILLQPPQPFAQLPLHAFV